ncbi:MULTISPECIES: hypothetical protein [unclassified Streptomyces]|uniref:hypothetical protein n=1 Tax=unclassified Streptomyces TaxID=2593676 RepID=UPI002DD92E56|nr:MULTISPECIES: hypothetical protein [unclassified Streptomyces]WSA95108.1 hypothetical protein OIE63_28815 [Streptomyces sp. NBC_01795]WSS12267.1 hypothetical protein OG533_10285 [Streptomyces sp. NBC_01186]WSS40980.1 hypothetical protein OG220_10440 [Streptomyces sp. NBC_01187]
MSKPGTPTVQELRHLRLAGLDAAITDWRALHRRLGELTEGGGGGKSTPDASAAAYASAIRDAAWSGENATAVRGFVTRTSARLPDLVEEAADVLRLLQSVHRAFTGHKSDLERALDGLAEDGIRLDDNGRASSATSSPVPRSQLDAAERRVARVLSAAAETDRTLTRELRALARRGYHPGATAPGGVQPAGGAM